MIQLDLKPRSLESHNPLGFPGKPRFNQRPAPGPCGLRLTSGHPSSPAGGGAPAGTTGVGPQASGNRRAPAGDQPLHPRDSSSKPNSVGWQAPIRGLDSASEVPSMSALIISKSQADIHILDSPAPARRLRWARGKSKFPQVFLGRFLGYFSQGLPDTGRVRKNLRRFWQERATDCPQRTC